MKKPLINKISKKKGVLIPLALVPMGVSVFFAMESNTTEQSPKVDRREPPAEVYPQPTQKQVPQELMANQLSAKVAIKVEDTKGTWAVDTYDDNKVLLSTFSLEIEHISNERIEGSYCYVSNYGRQEDCLNKFSGTALNANNSSTTNVRYSIDFHSSFKNLPGKAILDLNSNTITWDLTEFPDDLGVDMPKHAILTKDSFQLPSS